MVLILISQVSQSDLSAMKGNSFEVFYTSKFEVIFMIIMVEDAGDNQEFCKSNKIVGGFLFLPTIIGGILLSNNAIACRQPVKVSIMSQYLNILISRYTNISFS